MFASDQRERVVESLFCSTTRFAGVHGEHGEILTMKIPKEIIPKTSTKTILRTILSTLTLVMLANITIAMLLPLVQPNRGYWLIQQKWNWILNTKTPVDTLVLGDSSGNQGFIPKVYSNITGRSAYNACTIGDMTLSNDAWMLDKYLKRHKPPKRVIILHTFDAWNRPPQPSCLANIPISIGQLHPRLKLNIKQQKDYWLCRLFPLYSYSYSIKELILKPQQAFSERFHITNGYMCVQNPDPDRVHESVSNHITYIKNHPDFSLNTSQVTALKHINDLAAAFTFQVFLVNTPFCDQLNDNPVLPPYYEQVLRWFNQITQNLSNITFIGETITYPANIMEQDDHLIHETALDFTERASKILLF